MEIDSGSVRNRIFLKDLRMVFLELNNNTTFTIVPWWLVSSIIIMFELNVHHLTSRIDPYSTNHSISFGNKARNVSVGSNPLLQLVLLASLLVMASAIISNMKIKAFCKCCIYVYEYFLYIRDSRHFYIRLSLKKEARMFSKKKGVSPIYYWPMIGARLTSRCK